MNPHADPLSTPSITPWHRLGSLLSAAWMAGSALLAVATGVNAQGALAVVGLMAVLGAPVLLHGLLLLVEGAAAAVVNARAASRRPWGTDAAQAPEPAVGGGTWWLAFGREWALFLWHFLWLQPWRAQAVADGPWPPAPSPSAAPVGRSPRAVVLVHGYVCNRAFWQEAQRHLQAQGIPVMALTLGPPFASIDVQAQGLNAAFDQAWRATGRAPIWVGHSMGGLVIRSWLARQAPARPEAVSGVHEVVTVGTPHHGTRMAALARAQPGRQMRWRSDWIQALERDEARSPVRARFTCWWSLCDSLVFPAHSATRAGARQRAVRDRMHVGLATHPGLWDELTELAWQVDTDPVQP